MECDYSHAESSNWLKRGQYRISNCSTHSLRVQISRKEVSMELAVDRMALRTGREFKLIEKKSVFN